jgi:hypothetical protein
MLPDDLDYDEDSDDVQFGSDKWLWGWFDVQLRPAREWLRRTRMKDLPGMPIDQPEFGRNLPAIPAVYFVCRGTCRRPLYVGRTTNLRQRWSPAYVGTARTPWHDHHQLKRAVRWKNTTLRWLRVPPEHLAIVELLMIQIHKPRWNVVRN